MRSRKTLEKLAVLEMFEHTLSDAKYSDCMHILLTVKFGVETYMAYLRWCDEAKSIIAGALTAACPYFNVKKAEYQRYSAFTVTFLATEHKNFRSAILRNGN